MSNWKEYRIGDVVEIRHGYAFKGEYFTTDPTSDVLLTPGNFHIGGGFKLDKFKYYQGEVPPSYVLARGDVIVTMTDLSKEGDTLGYAAKIPKHDGVRFLHNQRLGKLIPKSNEVALDFLYWVMRTQRYQSFILGSASGTTVRHTSPSKIGEYRFKAPDLPTQNAIAEILSSLDGKIELNNQINQNLEALAQAIFKRWFVDFEFPDENRQPYKSSGGEMVESELGEIPKGWHVGSLGDILKVVNGFAFKSKEFSDHGQHRVIKIKNISEATFVDVSNTQFVGEEIASTVNAKFRLAVGDVLIAMTGAEVGKIGIVPNSHERLLLNQRVGKLQPLHRGGIGFTYFLFRSNDLSQQVRNVAMGSAQPNVSGGNIEGLKCIVPTDAIVGSYNELVEPQISMLLSHASENHALKSLRDTILPKLVSGGIKLDQLESQQMQAPLDVHHFEHGMQTQTSEL